MRQLIVTKVFNKQSPEECKPFESSFSKDCPPADWCVGCTVCDCDANGRWDCHLLSFCPDKKGMKKVRTGKSHKKTIVKHGNKKKPVNVTKKPPPKLNKSKVTPKPFKKIPENKRAPHKRQAKLTNISQKFKKEDTNNSNPLLLRHGVVKKSITTKKDNEDKDNIKIARNITKQVMDHSLLAWKLKKTAAIKSADENERTIKFAKDMIKQIIDNVHKMLYEEIGKITSQRAFLMKQNKTLQIQQEKKDANKNKANKKKKAHKKSPKRPRRKNGRRKREVATENFEPTSLTQFYPENIPDSLLNIVTTTEHPIPNDSSLVKSSFNLTTDIPNTTVTGSEYYKYSIDNNLNNTTTTRSTIFDEIYNKTEMIGSSVDNDESSDKTTDANNIHLIKDEGNISLFDKLLNLEFIVSKRDYMKLHKDKGKHLQKEIFFTKKFEQKHNPIIESYVPRPKVSRKDILKKIVKKNNLLKILNKTHSIPSKDETINSENYKMQITCYKLSDIQCILKQLLNEMNNNNATVNVETTTKRYKLNIFKIVKMLMRKIFSKKDSTENVLRNGNDNFNINKEHILEIICESVEPCFVQTGNKLWLKSKVKELNAETKNILTVIRTIKGLLQLVDIPGKYIDEVARGNPKFNDNVHKLSIILKGTYMEDNNISDANIIQIDNIKKHTQDFIISFGKFTVILNEMISALTGNNNVNQFCTNVKMGDNLIQNKYLPKLKSLFLTHNIPQNTFMRKMYQLLIGVENNSSKKEYISHKVSHDSNVNKAVAIENTRRLIENFRRLKTLAQILSSSRSKRDTRNEDTMEYMLLMMEYLLKQNSPLDDAPVNDGIDLLIEAIQNAPDIKSIKKKVLEYTPPTVMPMPIRTMKPITSIIRDENISNYNRISKIENITSRSQDSKNNEIEQNVKNEFMDNKIGESNTKTIYREPIADDIEKGIEPTTEIDNEMNSKEYALETVDKVKMLGTYSDERKYDVFTDKTSIADKVEKPDIYHNHRTHEGNVDENLNINKINKPGVYRDHEKYTEHVDENLYVNRVEKPGNAYLEDRKYEVYTANNDDYMMLNETKIEDVTEMNPSKVKETPIAAEMKYLAVDITTNSYDVTNGYKKSKLDWIEEAYDKEMKAYNEAYNTTSTTKPTTTKPVKFTNTEDSSKVVRVRYRKKKPRLNTEEVMLRKQMDLLNSLDYGTERSDFDDSGSKDGADSEDAFPTYFV